jgi:hypothetical protein
MLSVEQEERRSNRVSSLVKSQVSYELNVSAVSALAQVSHDRH